MIDVELPGMNRCWHLCDPVLSHKIWPYLLFTFPSTDINEKSMQKVTQKNFNRIGRIMQAAKLPIIGTVNESMMEKEYFFETPYHLNCEGRTVRSEKLGKEISHAPSLIAINCGGTRCAASCSSRVTLLMSKDSPLASTSDTDRIWTPPFLPFGAHMSRLWTLPAPCCRAWHSLSMSGRR